MRIPTPREQLYAWHKDAMDGLEPANDGTPRCGWFKRKLVRGGVFVPARIWVVQEVCPETGELLSDELMQCEVNGAFADPEDAWSWICAYPISEQEFRFLEASSQWAREHAPQEPMANPYQRIDWTAVPTPTF